MAIFLQNICRNRFFVVPLQAILKNHLRNQAAPQQKTSFLHSACTDFAPLRKHRGVEQLVARQAHNLEVARSNPASATTEARPQVGLFLFLQPLI